MGVVASTIISSLPLGMRRTRPCRAERDHTCRGDAHGVQDGEDLVDLVMRRHRAWARSSRRILSLCSLGSMRRIVLLALAFLVLGPRPGARSRRFFDGHIHYSRPDWTAYTPDQVFAILDQAGIRRARRVQHARRQHAQALRA